MADLVEEITRRVYALSDFRQLMLLDLLIGSNPADVARELDTLTAALLSNRQTED